MSNKKLTKKEMDFCRMYVHLRNPREAAIRSGFTLLPEYRAVTLLSKKHIRNKISELETENRADKALVSAGLQRLAFGSSADAVKLVLGADKTETPDLDSLDLFNVSEIKYTSGKGMEIKFFDRLKALCLLSELAQAEDCDEALAFYKALERSASPKNEEISDGGY